MEKLKVPLIKQETNKDCGPACLKMILEYFGKEASFNELYDLAGIKKCDAFWSIDLAIVAKKLGVNCEFYSTVLGVKEDNFELYSDMTSESIEEVKTKFSSSEEVGLKSYEKSLSEEEILKLLDEGRPVISLVDWDVVEPSGEHKYRGHFVVLIGYDKDFIYVNDPTSGEQMKIARNEFHWARKARGTDEDLIVF